MKSRIQLKKDYLVLLLIAAAVLSGLWLNRTEKTELLSNEGRTFAKARVTAVLEDNLQSDGSRAGSQTVEVEILSGAHRGEVLEASSSSSYLYGASCTVGLRVIVIISESENLTLVSVYNYDRGAQLGVIVGVLFLALGLIGGLKGWKSAAGLIFTFCCILWLFLPMIYRGVSPILAAVLVSVLTTVVVMYLIDGFTVKSLCSMAGTVLGVGISAVFAVIFGRFAHITGYNVSDIESLTYIGQMTGIQIGELMFAGILISALGAVMDVSMSVASTISEIHDKNPQLPEKELFQSGINVGKDMMGTMSNTLILAFAGGSLNTFVYIYCYQYSYYQVINMYDIGIEIVQGISATLGVVLTVPVVSLITAKALTRMARSRKSAVGDVLR